MTKKDQEMKKETVHSNVNTQEDIAKVLKDLQDKVNQLEIENRKFSEKEKAAIEAAREEMITDEDIGPCYLDPKYKVEGYHYRATDLTRRDKFEKRLKEGYEVARYSDATDIEASAVHDKSSLTDAITVNLGFQKECPGVWMRIPLERYKKRQQIKERRNIESLDAAVNTGATGASFGEVTIGNQTHFKKE